MRLALSQAHLRPVMTDALHAARWALLATLCGPLLALAQTAAGDVSSSATVAASATTIEAIHPDAPANDATSAGPLVLTTTAASTAAQSSGVFTDARARGVLVVGVPYLAAAPVAGAKIRTPERLDAVMAQRLGQQLGLPVKIVQIDAGQRTSALVTGDVDVLIADRVAEPRSSARARQGHPVGDALSQDEHVVPPASIWSENKGVFAVSTGYAARPKAIIRSDTRLRNWRDVKGQTVCMANAAFQAQALATEWGATLHPYRVPSDALVAVREGDCDIGLIDDTAWAALMAFPEWKKFSATLDGAGPRLERVWLTASGDPATHAWLVGAMAQWRRDGVVQTMVDKWARDVAFDVYLDQEVPDCHG